MFNLLVTGGLGFIGSHFIRQFHARHPDYTLINLDKMTYAADLRYLSGLETSPRYQFVKGDISDTALVNDLFERFRPVGVIHFAAESHVDNSIKYPDAFVKTNVLGTQTLLSCFKAYGSEQHRFVHVSTDEVYGSLSNKKGQFTEKTPLNPSSPYSASKAASDLLVQSYHHTYGLNTVISRCTNNFGPHQHQEKLIPTIIRHALAHEPIPIYGDGRQLRDWIYVGDHCDAIEKLYFKGQSGQVYHIGANCEVENIALAKLICQMIDRPESLITYVEDRLGHDYRYALNTDYTKKMIGWSAKHPFRMSLQATIQWYLEKFKASTCQVHLA